MATNLTLTSAPLTDDTERTLERLRAFSVLLDSSVQVPFINYRIGIDAIIGLIPGIGDAIGMLLSSYIVFEAARLQVPKSVLAQMAFNIALETIIGAVPLFGDLFDAAFKANIRNVKLLEQALKR